MDRNYPKVNRGLGWSGLFFSRSRVVGQCVFSSDESATRGGASKSVVAQFPQSPFPSHQPLFFLHPVLIHRTLRNPNSFISIPYTTNINKNIIRILVNAPTCRIAVISLELIFLYNPSIDSSEHNNPQHHRLYYYRIISTTPRRQLYIWHF